MLNLNEIEIEFFPIDYREENAQIERAWHKKYGRELSDLEIQKLEDKYSAELHALYYEGIY
jgi:hypothetical protein